MEKTWRLLILTTMILGSSLVFGQKNVVYKKIVSKKSAEKYLSGAKEIKDPKALMKFKGAIIKKYGISESDPYFNVGAGKGEDKDLSQNSTGGSSTQGYIVSLTREDVWDEQAYRNGDMDKAKTKPSSQNPRKFRCYHYVIGNVGQGKLDQNHESQCFLINENGYVDGEDPDVYEHDSDFNEVDDRSRLGSGCLKVAKCEPRNIKVKQSVGGKASMDEDEGRSFLGKIFGGGNGSKEKGKGKHSYKQKDTKMEIQSCVGGCGKGYKLIKIKYPLDGEEAPIREEIATRCGELEDSRYEPLEDAQGYDQALTSKGGDFVNRGFSKLYSSGEDDPLRNMYSEFDKNADSKYFIYVNKCVPVGDDGTIKTEKGTGGNVYKGKKTDKNKDEPKGEIIEKQSTSLPPKKKDDSLKIADTVINNGVIYIQQANGSRGVVLNQGGYQNQGWMRGGVIPMIPSVPQYAVMYSNYGASAMTPSMIMIDPRYMTQAMSAIQGGAAVSPAWGNMMNINGNTINSGNIYTDHSGNIIYNPNPSTGSPTNPVEVVVENGTKIPTNFKNPSECLNEVVVDQGRDACVMSSENKELVSTGKDLLGVYQHLCRKSGDELSKDSIKSLQQQCRDAYESGMAGVIAGKELELSGGNYQERIAELRRKVVQVDGVTIKDLEQPQMMFKCVDRTPSSGKTTDLSDSGVELALKDEILKSIDPSDYSPALSSADQTNLSTYFKKAKADAQQAVREAFSGVDTASISSNNIDEIAKHISLDFKHRGLATFDVLNSDENQWYKKNQAKIEQIAKDELEVILSKNKKIDSASKKKLQEKLTFSAQERYMVGPIPYVHDDSEMKKRIGQSSYSSACSDAEGSEEIYKCSLKEGCSYFKTHPDERVPSELDFCSDINTGESAFNKWYETSPFKAGEKSKPADVIYSSYSNTVTGTRNDSIAEPRKISDEDVITIGCDQILNDGAVERKIVVTKVEYKNKGKMTTYVRDEECIKESQASYTELMKMIEKHNSSVGRSVASPK